MAFHPREAHGRDARAVDLRPQANAAAADKPLLSIRGLRKHFGGVIAVDGVDLDVWPGQILGLIGPNGSRQDDGLQSDQRASIPSIPAP